MFRNENYRDFVNAMPNIWPYRRDTARNRIVIISSIATEHDSSILPGHGGYLLLGPNSVRLGRVPGDSICETQNDIRIFPRLPSVQKIKNLKMSTNS